MSNTSVLLFLDVVFDVDCGRLVSPERFDRVDLAGSPCGNRACRSNNKHQEEGDADESDRIVNGYTIEKTGQESGQENRSDEAGTNTDDSDSDALPHYQYYNFGFRRA